MGLMARYSGDFMPLKYSCTTVRYSTPISSSIQRTIRPRDIGLVWNTSSLVLMAAHPWREMGVDDTPSRPRCAGTRRHMHRSDAHTAARPTLSTPRMPASWGPDSPGVLDPGRNPVHRRH